MSGGIEVGQSRGVMGRGDETGWKQRQGSAILLSKVEWLKVKKKLNKP